MIAQLILSAAFLCFFAYAHTQRRHFRFIYSVVWAVAAGGLLLVWFPGISNRIAWTVGIGRGADLVFYSFIVFALLAILNLHLRIRLLTESMTENTRQIALLEAKIREPDADAHPRS